MKIPNFIYIFCDELRCDSLGCYGGSFETPNIDRLAKRGLLCENSFCNSPVCVASRFSILTSRYPEETGVYHNEAAYPLYPELSGFDTFVNVLSRNGYKTASFGKTHIPKTEIPVFDVNDGSGGEMNLGVDFNTVSNKFYPPGSFKSILAADYPTGQKFYPETVVENGLKWIEGQNNPYLIRFSLLQPHTPIIVPEKYTSKLNYDDFSGELSKHETSMFERRFREICDIGQMTNEEVKRMRLYYQAMVLWIDEQVGKILNFIEQRNELENTIFIFHADHGASRGENGCLAKQIFAPQSQRVPLIISGENYIKPGRKVGICDGLDIGPTVLSLAGIPIPKEFKGVNLIKESKQYIYATIGYGEKNSYAFPNKSQGVYSESLGWPRRSCIRTSRYRLDMNTRINGIRLEEGEDIFFCDYQEDPLEHINQSNDERYKKIIQKLKEQLLSHIEKSKEIEDTTVLNNPRGKIQG